jgi:quercetin dioxygenase-like cupin family protein
MPFRFALFAPCPRIFRWRSRRLEGSIVMQVRGGKETTLTPGQTFYEGPDDVHIIGRNASQTEPAKFVVFLVKDKGSPVLVPAK